MRNRSQQDNAETPDRLLSRRLVIGLVASVTFLVVLTVLITVAGRWLGARLAMGSHTEDSQEYTIQIGDDAVRIPANTIRFADQRRAGTAESLDLYLAWPDMQGYGEALREKFDDPTSSGSLIFLRLSESTMSRDMSGRLEPIYAQLFAGEPLPYTGGLTLHRLRPESGYGKEVVLTALRDGRAPYAVRCLLPVAGRAPTDGDCQRDIRVGRDMTVLYRFSSVRLPDWESIDASVAAYVQNRLVPGSEQGVVGR